jgi:hypothetical protein
MSQSSLHVVSNFFEQGLSVIVETPIIEPISRPNKREILIKCEAFSKIPLEFLLERIP